ncbi:hypothetical protein ES702_07829 [subsurface metagenome]
MDSIYYNYRKIILGDKIMAKKESKNETKSKGKRIKFIQVALTETEREIIRNFAKENKETSSTFCRRVIFDFIRRKENPEMFNQSNVNQIDYTIFEKLFENNQKILKLQEEMQKRQGIADNIEEISEILQKEYENLKNKGKIGNLTNDSKIIANLLKGHKSLSLKQITEMTNFGIEKVIRIITNSEIFKLNITTGRYSLR